MESSAVTPLAENKCRYCLVKLCMQYIKCAECDNINLCIPCFSCGVEGGSHKKNHQYFIKSKENKENMSILYNTKVKWTWEEEKKLLDALELYAIGNWVDIAEKVGSKTPDECHQHYSKFYIHGCMGQLLIDRSATSKCHVTDHTFSSGNLTTPTLHQTGSLIEANPEEQLLLGYMPKRDDFERDYDNDAESILCKLHPSFEKDELEEALKVAQISIYTHRLKERQRRKAIAREHNLIPYIMANILNKKVGANIPGAAATIEITPTTESDSVSNSRILSKRGRGSALSRTAGRGRGRPSGSTAERPTSAVIKENGKSFNGSRRSSMSSQVNEVESSTNQSDSLLPNSRPMNSCYLSMLSTRAGRPKNRKPYNAFHIEDRLKPFLRYFTGIEGKQFLENLEREDRLRKEITELAEQRRKGKTKMSMVKLRDYSSGRVFVNGTSRSISDDTRASLPRGRGRGRKRGRKKLLFSLYQNYKMRRRLTQNQNPSQPNAEIKSE